MPLSKEKIMKDNILYITGAGVSAESGIPTFGVKMAFGPLGVKTTPHKKWLHARCIFHILTNFFSGTLSALLLIATFSQIMFIAGYLVNGS
jgi:hypothetical protein